MSGKSNARPSHGTLIASGFIAGGLLFGILKPFLKFFTQEALSFGYANWYMSAWVDSYSGEISGLIIFTLLFSYATWDTMRAKEE
jgi:hypothetical protein